MADLNEAMRIFHEDFASLLTSEANVRRILDNGKRQLDEQRAELVREREEWQSRIRMLDTQVANQQATIAQRNKKVDDQNVQIEQLKETIDRAKSEHNADVRRLKNAQQAVANVEELRRENSELEAALQRCKTEYRKTQAAIENQISEHSKELLKETELRANALDANQRAYEASLRDAAYEIDELKAENVKLRPLLDRAKFLQYQVDSLIKMNDGYRKQLRNERKNSKNPPNTKNIATEHLHEICGSSIDSRSNDVIASKRMRRPSALGRHNPQRKVVT